MNDDDSDPQPRYEYTNENRSAASLCYCRPLLCVSDMSNKQALLHNKSFLCI